MVSWAMATARKIPSLYPHDPLPEPWQRAFDLWRELAHGHVDEQVRRAGLDDGLRATGPMHALRSPDILEALSHAWRQQMFEATVWRILALVPVGAARSIKIKPGMMRSGRYSHAVEVEWLPEADPELKRLVNKTWLLFRKSQKPPAPYDRKQERDAMTHAVGHRAGDRPGHSYQNEASYTPGLSMEGTLRQMAPHLGLAGRQLVAGYQKMVLEEGLDAGAATGRRGPRL
jgi:hypothetical protein